MSSRSILYHMAYPLNIRLGFFLALCTVSLQLTSLKRMTTISTTSPITECSSSSLPAFLHNVSTLLSISNQKPQEHFLNFCPFNTAAARERNQTSFQRIYKSWQLPSTQRKLFQKKKKRKQAYMVVQYLFWPG